MNTLGFLYYVFGLVFISILLFVLTISNNIIISVIFIIIFGVPAWYLFKKGWYLRTNTQKTRVPQSVSTNLGVYVLTANDARSYFNDVSMHFNDIIENSKKRYGKGIIFKLFHPKIKLMGFDPLIIDYDRLSKDQVDSYANLLDAYSSVENNYMLEYNFEKLSNSIESIYDSYGFQRKLHEQVDSGLYNISLNSKETRNKDRGNGFIGIKGSFFRIQLCPSFVIFEIFPFRCEYSYFLPVDYSEVELKINWSSHERFQQPESSDRIKDIRWRWEYANKDGSRDKRRKNNRKEYHYNKLHCFISVNHDSIRINDPRLIELDKSKMWVSPEFPDIATMMKFGKAFNLHKKQCKSLSAPLG